VIPRCVSTFKLFNSITDARHERLKLLFRQFKQETQLTVGLEENVDNIEQFLFGHDASIYPKPLYLSMRFKSLMEVDTPCSKVFVRFGFGRHELSRSAAV
jgi:hypothetical protein